MSVRGPGEAAVPPRKGTIAWATCVYVNKYAGILRPKLPGSSVERDPQAAIGPAAACCLVVRPILRGDTSIGEICVQPRGIEPLCGDRALGCH